MRQFFVKIIRYFILIYSSCHFLNTSFANESHLNLDKAEYYFLMDADNMDVLLSSNPDIRISPSSMTKLMTAYVVFDQIKKGVVNINNRCLIGKDAWRKSGSSMFLNYGDIVTVEDLIKGLLAVSGNDASIALANTTASSYSEFVSLMNIKAQQLNLKNSHFMNPHGLHEEGHFMSLRDLAYLTVRLFNDFPEYAKFLNISEFTYGNITQRNRNPLIVNKYDGTLGGKTGHTNQGGYGVVALVERDNRKLVAAVNKAKTPKIREKVITELFDYGFQNFQKINIVTKDQVVAKIPTWLGNKNYVKLVTNKNIKININNDKSINDIKVKAIIKSPLLAPIKKDSKVGILVVNIKDKKTMQYDLYAKESVDKVGYIRKIKRIIEYKINKLIKNT